ncbi:MAG: hypothetical protein GXY57_04450 [Erysipelotrichaceae bacterium]|jgi:hypothetical protein|nr:hypothetical protein [Bacilli bacterium]NLV29383.1 hypothetical protein [Erysipelotrichaceae bacterium]HPY79891.1 hypothetical protein [Bacilli bacterium]HQA55875.1 hypothetical protein [Bacilli bacterium]
MPVCRNCNSRISKFDKDICPICGAKSPLDGVNSETVEVTSEIDVSNPEFAHAKPRSKKLLLALFCLVGFTGAPFVYFKYIKLALIWFLLNALLIGGGSAFLYFLTPLGLWSLLVGFSTSYVINIAAGVVYFKTTNLKDGNGEFVR